MNCVNREEKERETKEDSLRCAREEGTTRKKDGWALIIGTGRSPIQRR